MSVITIQDFSGMMPLRDGILLPDRNAQYAKNTWLYKGSIRGFRHAIPVYTALYSDTQQVYRIPNSTALPPDFINSRWLEFPDPFIAVIRNPVVGDQWNRYYFFPSDQCAPNGDNPDFAFNPGAPVYNTLDRIIAGDTPLYLGIPAPADPPVVVPAPITVVKTATADVAAGGTTLTLNNTTDLSDGMTITDLDEATPLSTTMLYDTPPNRHPIDTQTIATTNPASGGGAYHTYQTSAAASSGGNTLAMQSVSGIVNGMIVVNRSNSSRIATGSTVTGVSGSNVTISKPFTADIILDDFISFESLAANVLQLSTIIGISGGMGVTNNTNPSSIPGNATVISISDFADSRITLSTNVSSIVNVGDSIEVAGINSNELIVDDPTTPAGVVLPGMTVTDVTNPGALIFGTTVVYAEPFYVVISQDCSSTGVTNGDTIHFANNVFPNGGAIDDKGVVDATHVNTTQPTAGAGVINGDQIQFDVTDIEVRAYVYTYVSAYGEEGSASQPDVETGNPVGTWHITIPAIDPAILNNRNLAKIRLYRTVVDTAGNAAYYQVTDIGPPFPTGVTVYDDSAEPKDVVSNSPLTSELYTPPPADLQGVVMMANGIAAGWSNEREIWFSAAYLPHAWPASYALTVDYPIVGLTANGASLNILCEGAPFIATGVTPDTMTIGKISSNEPCNSRGSIVSSGEGAYYSSPNGLILLNSSGTTSITEFVYEKEFHNSLQPLSWAAGHYGLSYVAFIKGAGLTGIDPDGLTIHGLVLEKEDKNTPFCYLNFRTTVKNMYFDEMSGQLFGLQSNNTIMQWNPPIGIPGTTTLWDWTWMSKPFRMAFPASFKAIKIIFEVPDEVMITLGPRNTDQNQVYDPTTQYLIIKVFADDRFVMVKEIQASEEILLIPDGFKATLWELELQGQVNVTHLKMSTSVKELRKA
jgi:hypothetical protein